jgi:hypothetical protein
MVTMEGRFDLLMNPPKMLKVRMIIAALHDVDLDRISETHGEVRAKMKQTLKNNLDWEYEYALKVLAQAEAARAVEATMEEAR